MRHRSRVELEQQLAFLESAPVGVGSLELVVRRPAARTREVLAEGELDLDLGLVGDDWSTRGSRQTPDGSANLDMQLTVMSHRMVSLLASDAQALAGDQLYVDLDLSHVNLPAGSRLAIGPEAVIEVSEIPHRGCAKFVERFGPEAMRFVNGRVGRQLRLRGLNARVVVGGLVRPGDKVAKL